MRNLTAQQKKLLNTTLKLYNKRNEMGELNIEIYSVDELPTSVWDKLEELNDTEVLWQNTNRFIGDFNSNLTN